MKYRKEKIGGFFGNVRTVVGVVVTILLLIGIVVAYIGTKFFKSVKAKLKPAIESGVNMADTQFRRTRICRGIQRAINNSEANK